MIRLYFHTREVDTSGDNQPQRPVLPEVAEPVRLAQIRQLERAFGRKSPVPKPTAP